jgi:hypothetical protein
MKEKYICCICNNEFEGFGNNPWPLKRYGRCCDECNMKVIEARISNIKEKTREENAITLFATIVENLDRIGESETLSIITMMLERYTTMYNKSLNDTITLLRKGYNKYAEILKESD